MSHYKKNLCSVCCLGYNHANFLEQTIRSIWNDGYQDIEIIALDDGSSDESVKILNELADKSPFPMRVIAQENTGHIAKNINRLLKYASGEFVAVIALDDVYDKGCISKKAAISHRWNVERIFAWLGRH